MKGNTKGITPIIAIILLMMITIALAGFTYIWLQGVFKTSSNNTKTQLEQQQRSMMKTIRIDSATSGTGELAIRNTGSESITSNEIAVFVFEKCTGQESGFSEYLKAVTYSNHDSSIFHGVTFH